MPYDFIEEVILGKWLDQTDEGSERTLVEETAYLHAYI